MVNKAVLNDNDVLDKIAEYLGLESDLEKCEICDKTSLTSICPKCSDTYNLKGKKRIAQKLKLSALKEGFVWLPDILLS